MECGDCTERFADWLDGSLDGEQTRRMAVHLERCPACRLRWAQYQGLVETLRAPITVEVRPGFADQVVARVSSHRWGEPRRGLSALVIAHGRLAAAAAVIVVGLAAGLHLSHRPSGRPLDRPLAVATGTAELPAPPPDGTAGPVEPSTPLDRIVRSSSSTAGNGRSPSPSPETVAPQARTAPLPPANRDTGDPLRHPVAPTEVAPSPGSVAPPPTPSPSLSAPDAQPRDRSDSAAERRRAAMNLIGGSEGMYTSFSTESIESARARQMIRENPYSNAAPEKWSDPSRTHYNFEFRGTRLSTALDSVAKTGNIRIITRGPMNGNVTLNIQNARPEVALERIASIANLRVSQRGSTYVVEQEPVRGESSDSHATRPDDTRPPQ